MQKPRLHGVYDGRKIDVHLTSQQISHAIKRLRLHGLIRRIGKTYKYYLTEFGRSVATMGLKLKELLVIPELAHALAR